MDRNPAPGKVSSTSADLICLLKDVLCKDNGADWSETRLELKALVCDTSYAGEKEPKAILINTSVSVKELFFESYAHEVLLLSTTCSVQLDQNDDAKR